MFLFLVKGLIRERERERERDKRNKTITNEKQAINVAEVTIDLLIDNTERSSSLIFF